MSSCHYCGLKMEYTLRNPLWGHLWMCDKCGRMFCDACFIERQGVKNCIEMHAKAFKGIHLCPTCYGKRSAENDK